MCIFQLLSTLSPGVKWQIQEVRGLTNRVPNKRPLYRAGEWESVLQGIHPSTSNSIPSPFPLCETNRDMTQEELFKKLIAHCKEYGFVFPSSEIYDGLGAVYDYGQNGVAH